MSTTSNQLGKQAKCVTEDLEKMGGIVRDAAQEKLGQLGEEAVEYYEQGRDKFHDATCVCLKKLRERPLLTVLIAAAIGWLLGRFWNRR